MVILLYSKFTTNVYVFIQCVEEGNYIWCVFNDFEQCICRFIMITNNT